MSARFRLLKNGDLHALEMRRFRRNLAKYLMNPVRSANLGSSNGVSHQGCKRVQRVARIISLDTQEGSGKVKVRVCIRNDPLPRQNRVEEEKCSENAGKST
jgi:hypothetical protein